MKGSFILIPNPLKLDCKVILVTTLYRKRIGFYFNGKSLSEEAIHNSPPDEIYGQDQFELVPRLSIGRFKEDCDKSCPAL